jgi:carnitine-CoA ligase
LKLKSVEDCTYPGSLLRIRAKGTESQSFAFYKNEAIGLVELESKSNRLSNSLAKMGIKKGDNVAIISHSNLEYLVCEFGIWKAGAICVPINCLLRAHELSYLLSQSQTKLVFVHNNYEKEFLTSQVGSLKRIPHYLLDKGGNKAENSIHSLIAEGYDSIPTEEPGYYDPSCIIYTSGTTGAPKGVVYENYGILPLRQETYVQQMMDAIVLGPKDTTYLPFALYHILGQVHVIGALRNGGKIALADKFSTSQYWNDVKRYGATVLVHQGASIPLLLRQPPSDSDKAHNARVSVGAGVPSEEVWRSFEARFGVKIYEHYAQTEGAFFGAGTVPTNRAGTIGLQYKTARIRILDDFGIETELGRPGQLVSCLKSEFARKRPEDLYYNDVPKSLARFTEDGWFKSGDIVRVDEDGYFHYVGKVETFIRYRGENISPLQIEAVLSTHPLVDECIAVGVPNQELGGDDIKIVVSKKPGPELSPDDLITWCGSELPKFMIPRYIQFVDELKKTEQTKKIMRSEYIVQADGIWDRLNQAKTN